MSTISMRFANIIILIIYVLYHLCYTIKIIYVITINYSYYSVMITGKSDIQGQLNTALQDITDKYLLLEETEKNAVRQALIEQRSHFCQFLYNFKPVVVRSHCCLIVYVALSWSNLFVIWILCDLARSVIIASVVLTSLFPVVPISENEVSHSFIS